MANEQGLVFIHPFDDPDVIAGQGTIGMEIHQQHAGPVDAVFVPIGGGGLISGIAEYLKARSPDTGIIGVEPEESASMFAALAAGRPVTEHYRLERADIITPEDCSTSTRRILARFS